MWEKALPWIGGIFAAVGLILIFYDLILSIKRRDKTKTNIAGLIILSIAVIGYIFTDLIFTDSVWPPLASLIWIALFWTYVIMDACVTLGAIKKHRRDKKTAATLADKDGEQAESDGNGEESETATAQATATEATIAQTEAALQESASSEETKSTKRNKKKNKQSDSLE